MQRERLTMRKEVGRWVLLRMEDSRALEPIAFWLQRYLRIRAVRQRAATQSENKR